MKKYYLHDGKDQQGPFDIEVLKAKNITEDASIWYEGLSEWTIAGNVLELKELFVNTTPPPFVAKSTIPHLPQKQPIQQSPVTPKPIAKKKNKLGIVLQSIGVIGVIIIAIIVIRSNNNSNSGSSNNDRQTYQEKVLTVAETENSQPTQFLKADGNFSQNLLGTKLKVHGVIKNSATVATFKDAKVKVTYYSKTKTILGSKNYTIYETFAPHSSVNFELKIENYQDVNTIGWDVIDATAIERSK